MSLLVGTLGSGADAENWPNLAELTPPVMTDLD